MRGWRATFGRIKTRSANISQCPKATSKWWAWCATRSTTVCEEMFRRPFIIHSYLKPSNIMVSRNGLVKILDFGLAKLTERSEVAEDNTTRTLNPKTDAGTVIGTVPYMSPEQAEGRPTDARSDIFSF